MAGLRLDARTLCPTALWEHLDLGWAIDLRDVALAWDGMHLTPAGNAALAAKLAGPVGALLP